MKRYISPLALFLLLSTAGCFREEYKSVVDTHAVAQARYDAASKASLPEVVATELSNAEKALSGLNSASSPAEISSHASALSGHLSTLLPHTGYTGRPALTELRNQLLVLGDSKDATEGQAKLIASRVLNFLASELETSRFPL